MRAWEIHPALVHFPNAGPPREETALEGVS
jgi:hypothetical protein